MFPSLDPVENLNRYQYVGANPVNYADPSGMMFWPGRGTGRLTMFQNGTESNDNVSIRAQILFMEENPTRIHAEYPIPVRKLRDQQDGELDAAVEEMLSQLPNNTMYVDLLDENSAEIWEIKPRSDRAAGRVQVNAQLIFMIALSGLGELKGTDHPVSGDYDWNSKDWALGYRYIGKAPVILGHAIDLEGKQKVFYAQQQEVGLIIWWKVDSEKEDPISVPLPLPDRVVESRRNRQKTHPDTVYDPQSGREVPNPALVTWPDSSWSYAVPWEDAYCTPLLALAALGTAAFLTGGGGGMPSLFWAQ